MSILIKNGRIWDGDRFFCGDILTEDERIAEIAPHIDADAKYIYDAQGKTVSAGLVDAHMHIRGISSDAYGMSAEMACLPLGVTAACDAGGNRGSRMLLQRSAVKAVVFADSVIANNHLNTTATRRNLALYGDKDIGIKLFYDGGGKKVWDMTPLREGCAFARSLGVKVMVHCNHSPTSMLSIVETLAPGDILSHVYHGGVHDCTEDDFAAFRLAKEKGVVMDAAFAGYVHTDFRVLRAAIAAGHLPDTISTDLTKNSVYKRGGRYGLPMCMSMARTAGMDEEAIFRAVTTAPAKALGQPWGKLEVGGRADIVVLEYTNEPFSLTDPAGNSLESPMGYRCKLTVADGVVLFRD